jgi:hypothetical protein
VYTLDQKLTGADGKETSFRVQHSDGKDIKQSAGGPIDTSHAKKIDAHTWDFDLKKDGTVIGHVHRVVSADGKTLTAHNTGTMISGVTGEEALVFDKQWSRCSTRLTRQAVEPLFNKGVRAQGRARAARPPARWSRSVQNAV